MTDVSFCEDGVGLFYFFGGDGTDRAGLGGGCIPRRWRPQPPAHPERLHSTGSSTGRARCKADRPQQTTHQHDTPGHLARCTGLHSISDKPRRVDQDGGGTRGCAQCVRNCADMDRTHRHTIANTKKCAMLRTQLDTNTKKCYHNARNKRTLKSVTPPQNRRTKP